MLKSLKSKFIISFIVMEVIFFSLIVGLNFNSLDKASKTLTKDKLEISSQLLVELVKTPLITYDLATLDDIVKTFSKIDNVVAIQVDDANEKMISGYSSDGSNNKSIHENSMYLQDDKYITTVADIIVEDEYLGHIEFVFDITEQIQSIKNNKYNTYILITFALIIGLIVSYIIGSDLGKSLKKLTNIAKQVADDKEVTILYSNNYSDEIGELFYAMHKMQKHITERTTNLNNTLNNLQQFINALNHSAIVTKTDPSGVITYVNSKFCEVTGYREDELIGKTHGMLRPDDIEDNFYKNMWQTITSKQIFHATFKNIKKNGEPYYVDATIVPLLDNRGDISEYIAIRYEVTEIINAKEKALEAKKVKEEFLSNMSHEIRTPMNAILGFVKVLQKNTTDEKNLSHLKIIENSSQTLLYIINDILDLSKIENGKLIIDKHPFNSRLEFTQAIELYKLIAQEKSINLQVNIDKDIPLCLVGDLIRIKQILFNLLSNALKFTQENKNIFVDIVYKPEDSTLSISVKDEGIGMSPEVQGKIFNAFEQADNSTTRKFGGTGLGLSISSKLAKLMDAKIILESEEDVGSTFTLSLPIEVCTEDFDALSNSNGDTDAKDIKLIGKVLIAEDNKMNQMLLTILLDDYELKYSVANDGVEAVEAFKDSKYDIVLMDENMPNMTGLKALEQILAYEKENQLDHTPVIALTANVMQEDKDRFKDAGMDDFLAKPIDTKELERVLKKFLKIKK